jgi:hypothetical protein
MKALFRPAKIGLVTALLLAAPAVAQDRYENDDSSKSARVIGNGQAQDHTLHVADDADWMYFTIGANGATNLRVETLETYGDTELWLYGPNSASRRIAYDDNGGPGAWSLITQPSLAPGTYYLLVQSEDGEPIEDGYTLRVHWIENSSPPDSFERDDTSAAAKTIVNGGAQNRSIHAHVDIDWVTFTIGPDGASDFRAETEGGEGDTEMWLLGPNSSSRQIVYNDNGLTGGWSLITQATLVPGTYYLNIQSKGNVAAIFYYTLHASWTNNVPRITKQPTSQAVAAGTAVTFTSEASPGPWTYEWLKDGRTLQESVRIKGVASLSLTIAQAEAGDAGTFSVRVWGVTGMAISVPVQLAVTSADQAPLTIIQHPTHQRTSIAQGATFTVVARGNTPLAYQWEHLPRGSLLWSPLTDGGNDSGTRTPTLTMSNVPLDMNGDAFRCIVSNSFASTASNAAILVVEDGPSPGSRLSNISILTALSLPGDRFTLGYVVGGAGTTGTKPLLLRAAGPSLAALGATGEIADPKLELFAGSLRAEENDDWGGATALSEAFARVGAFPYSAASSRDAAAIVSRAPGNNSMRVSGAGDAIGLVLAEIYDATPATAFGAATPRLINVSVLHQITAGLTAGFVIAGNGSKTILIRAAGPTLGAAPFDLSGTVADPQLNLYFGDALLSSNDDWETSSDSDTTRANRLLAAFARVGAFRFPSGAKDAALLVTLQPGNFTVEVTGATGLALLEIYEVP